MMKYLVTYASHYGSTRRYAHWIGEALGCDVMDVCQVNAKMLEGYDAVIHGGGLYAGGVSGLKRILKIAPEKLTALFTCGLADPGDPENVAHIAQGLEKALPPETAAHVRRFHFRGGIDYPALNPIHRAMMAMLRKALLKRPPEERSAEDQRLLDTYGSRIDYCDRASIAPLVEYITTLP